MKTSAALLISTSVVSAFTPSKNQASSSNKVTEALDMASAATSTGKPIYDPLGLYGKLSPERVGGQIRPMEEELDVNKPVLDPLNLYSDNKEGVSENMVMSQAVPFIPRPAHLTGELAGDVGFDPLNLADGGRLEFMREAELKHGRIAMLAAAGWPLAELLNKQLAHSFDLPTLLTSGDRVPSVLNGGLFDTNVFYWGAVLALAGGVEVWSEMKGKKGGDVGFDPLGLFPTSEEGQKRMRLSEIKNGRLAMMAITGFAIQEAFTKLGVVSETPFFFHPITGLN